MGATTGTRVGIRWAIRRDIPAMLACGLSGWTEGRFLKHLKRRNTIGMVAEDSTGKVVGYVLYRLGRADGTGGDWLRLLAFVVHPAHRRQGIGSALLAKIAYKLHTHRRPVAVCTVPESALPAQLSLRAEGWTCARIIPARFGEEAGYQFAYRASPVVWTWRNGVYRSRCRRWKVYHDGRGWLLVDNAPGGKGSHWPSLEMAKREAEEFSEG